MNGRNGANGKSAYISAIDAGFQGTEEEWLKSLKGKDGADGKSAYALAVENGFVGSEEDWLKSLKGKDGLLLDAPSDGKTYGRNNEQWVEITDSGGSKIEDAPSDGKAYARKDGAWVQSVHSSDVYTKSQADEQFLPSSTSIPSKTSDLTNDSGFITAASVPSKTSELTNDSGFITEIPDEYVTGTEMSEYAQPKGDYALKSELFSKSYNDLTDKPTIPSKTSELTNDAGFLTAIPEEYATKAYLDEKIGNIDAILDSINGEVI